MSGGNDPKPCDTPVGKRRHVRVAVQLQVNFTIVGDAACPPRRALTRDISHGGACLALPCCTHEMLERLDGRPLLGIAIVGVAATSLQGRVEWVRHPETPGAPALVGVEFSDVSAADEVAIIDLIAHILTKSQIGELPVPSLPHTPLLLC